MNCYVHEDRPATRVLRVPCAPNGQLVVCDHCFQEANRGPVFEKYFAEHQERVRAQRARDARRRVGDN